MDILDQINNHKRTEIAEAKGLISLEQLMASPYFKRKTNSLKAALLAEGVDDERLTPAVPDRVPSVANIHVPPVPTKTETTPKERGEVSVRVNGDMIFTLAAVFLLACAIKLWGVAIIIANTKRLKIFFI